MKTVIRLTNYHLDNIIEDDIAITASIKNLVGYTEEGEFHFELDPTLSEYIISRFTNVLRKTESYYKDSLGRNNLVLSFSIGTKQDAPKVETTIVEEEPTELAQETVVDVTEQEEQPKRKTRK